MIETATTKQHDVQKNCEEVIITFTSNLNPDIKPTRIDPELVNKELMMLSLAMEKKYPDVNQTEKSTFQHAPPGRTPIMTAYNLETSVQKFLQASSNKQLNKTKPRCQNYRCHIH